MAKLISIILSQENALGIFIPAGFAHAYYSYDEENIIYYKLNNYYNPKFESGILYKDPDLKFKITLKKVKISKKDKNYCHADQFKKRINIL